MNAPFDEKLLDYATDRQRELLLAWKAQGTQRAAAEALGVSKNNINQAHAALQKKAAIHGYAPGHWQDGTAPGYRMGKVTVQRTPDGGVERVWERQHPEQAEIEGAIRAAAEAVFREYPPLSGPELEPGDLDDTLIPWFEIGDAHLGMVAWARETGHNFDLDIGARELLFAFKMLVDRAPRTRRCVINDLGDFTHYENFKAETEASGHRLDADGRFPKMAEVVAVCWRVMIDYALQKYETVDVIVNQGNHSRTNDIWIRVMLEMLYGDCGRVNVLPNSGVFVPYKMGDTFVVTHHSDKASGKRLVDAVLTTYHDFVKECRFIYVDTGHIHHHQVSKEYGLVQVESWNNLSPNDAHHHNAGWRSKQSMSCAVRSVKYGQLDVLRVPIEMVWERLQLAMGEGVVTSRPKPEVFVAA